MQVTWKRQATCSLIPIKVLCTDLCLMCALEGLCVPSFYLYFLIHIKDCHNRSKSNKKACALGTALFIDKLWSGSQSVPIARAYHVDQEGIFHLLDAIGISCVEQNARKPSDFFQQFIHFVVCDWRINQQSLRTTFLTKKHVFFPFRYRKRTEKIGKLKWAVRMIPSPSSYWVFSSFVLSARKRRQSNYLWIRKPVGWWTVGNHL